MRIMMIWEVPKISWLLLHYVERCLPGAKMAPAVTLDMAVPAAPMEGWSRVGVLPSWLIISVMLMSLIAR
jgi:hypothetical protein